MAKKINTIELSIILVNWNSRNVIIRCIDSLQKYIKDVRYEIIVVDNNSTDGSLEIIERDYPSIKVIKNNFNNLFAGANNQGYQAASGDYILILNSDTEVFDSTIQDLFYYYKANNNLGAITCKLLNSDYTTQYYMHRRFPSCTNIIFSFLHKKYKSFLPKGVREYMYLDKDFKTSFYIKQVAGAFIMTTRDVVESIGGLFDEERFPLFYNDVDFSYRIYEHSLKILCVSDKSILHLKGESTGKLNFLKSGKYYAPAALWFFKKHNKKFDYLVLKISFLILFSTLVILKMISFRTQDRKNEYLKTKKILFEIVRI